MAEFKNEKLGVSFTLPEKITVRQQLAYFSEAGLAYGDDLFIRLFRGACNILSDWKCESMPDVKISLDETTDPKITEIILWVAMEVKAHMNSLDSVPKN